MDAAEEDEKVSSHHPKLKVDWRQLRKQKQESKRKKELKRVRKAEEEEESLDRNEKRKNKEKLSGISQTVSIAVPASIVDNAQSAELKTYLIGQIARACVIYQCDEIIVYDEYSSSKSMDRTNCITKMVKILQYLECPQYLRKYLFPIHQDLQHAGLLNPVDSPHHLREYDESQFREGVVIDLIPPDNDGCYVNIGLCKEILIPQCLSPGLRVTVELDLETKKKKKMRGIPVPPSDPRKRTGRYWGYSVRVAGTFSAVFSECPYSNYDLTIGTSERGESVDVALQRMPSNYEHALIVFGGLKGIEAAIDADETYSNINDPLKIFDYYINSCPNQGSNTIRTEEAILITLSSLRSKLPISMTNMLPTLSDRPQASVIQMCKNDGREISFIYSFLDDVMRLNEELNRNISLLQSIITCENKEKPAHEIAMCELNKAKLLRRGKMKTFMDLCLVAIGEIKPFEGDRPVNVDDLEGYWSLLDIEVKKHRRAMDNILWPQVVRSPHRSPILATKATRRQKANVQNRNQKHMERMRKLKERNPKSIS